NQTFSSPLPPQYLSARSSLVAVASTLRTTSGTWRVSTTRRCFAACVTPEPRARCSPIPAI
ncbi:hypothetical protein PD653_0001, partial [Nocardioides sp. PD653]